MSDLNTFNNVSTSHIQLSTLVERFWLAQDFMEEQSILLVTTKPKVKSNFRAAAIALSCSLQNYYNETCVFFFNIDYHTSHYAQHKNLTSLYFFRKGISYSSKEQICNKQIK